ncbi:hypothetical protein Bbelb_339230 [Branchiostoma belcheri]|nr:hypothetical protein Bbelb_339230 [Branchiostoma belcheri]
MKKSRTVNTISSIKAKVIYRLKYEEHSCDNMYMGETSQTLKKQTEIVTYSAAWTRLKHVSPLGTTKGALFPPTINSTSTMICLEIATIGMSGGLFGGVSAERIVSTAPAKRHHQRLVRD